MGNDWQTYVAVAVVALTAAVFLVRFARGRRGGCGGGSCGCPRSVDTPGPQVRDASRDEAARPGGRTPPPP